MRFYKRYKFSYKKNNVNEKGEKKIDLYLLEVPQRRCGASNGQAVKRTCSDSRSKQWFILFCMQNC